MTCEVRTRENFSWDVTVFSKLSAFNVVFRTFDASSSISRRETSLIENYSRNVPQRMLHNWHKQFHGESTRHHWDTRSGHCTLLIECTIDRTLNRENRIEMSSVWFIDAHHRVRRHRCKSNNRVYCPEASESIYWWMLMIQVWVLRDGWSRTSQTLLHNREPSKRTTRDAGRLWRESETLYFLLGRSNHCRQPTRFSRISQ